MTYKSRSLGSWHTKADSEVGRRRSDRSGEEITTAPGGGRDPEFSGDASQRSSTRQQQFKSRGIAADLDPSLSADGWQMHLLPCRSHNSAIVR